MNTRVPEFFGRVRRIVMRDPLARFLGAAEDGLIEYSYLDAVKLSGHSCPTVAAAYQATLEALDRLYPDSVPERGSIRVELRDAIEDGTTGVVASVAGLITGAAGGGGFKGIAGRFARTGLLEFGAPIAADLRFTRLDTARSVEVNLRHAPAMSPGSMRALQTALSPDATAAEREEFAGAWQKRAAAMLVPDKAIDANQTPGPKAAYVAIKGE